MIDNKASKLAVFLIINGFVTGDVKKPMVKQVPKSTLRALSALNYNREAAPHGNNAVAAKDVQPKPTQSDASEDNENII